MNDKQELLEKFVEHFAHYDQLLEWQNVPVLFRYQTPGEVLEPLYTCFPAKFPPLYKKLVLTYRWHRAEVGEFNLLANPPGPDLSGLLHEGFAEETLKHGYIHFAFWDGWHDPICFDTKSGKNARIVRLDHEELLLKPRVRVVAQLFNNFEDFVHAALMGQECSHS